MGTPLKQSTAEEAQFEARLAKIRGRFILKLADKIQQTDAALPQMAGEDSTAVNAVAAAYRWFHDLGGIGSTIGFEATGRLAVSCDRILVGAFRAQRGLLPEELALLAKSLESLRVTALAETVLPDLNQGSTS